MDSPYFDKDVSALQFNGRVLDLASDEEVPLFERIRFLVISFSNVEEFTQSRGSKILGNAGVQTELALIKARQFEIRKELTAICERDGLPTDFTQLSENAYPTLRYPRLEAEYPTEAWDNARLWDYLDKADYLKHHPYDSFEFVSAFVRNAARDPAVKSISMTMYRVGNRSDIIDYLVEAAQAGKKVHVLVELKARMDEERNLTWASRLEFAGAQVSYGFASWKTHAKLCVVRRRNGKKEDSIYSHIGTGNYNSTTAATYADLSLFTSDKSIGNDILKLFRYLRKPGKVPLFRTISVSPFHLRADCIRLIEEQADLGQNGRIDLKMNSLTDELMVDKLYAAAGRGVQVRAIVRGACIMRPRENIEITSLVHRFLEHSRLFVFGSIHDGKTRVFMSSSDWKTNALDKRIEHMLELHDPCATRAVGIMGKLWDEHRYSWRLQEDGEYVRNI